MNEDRDAFVGDEAQEKARTFEQIAVDEAAWTVLYQDPVTGEFWRESYPWPEAHGGGPPRLDRITREEATHEFRLAEGPAGEAGHTSEG